MYDACSLKIFEYDFHPPLGEDNQGCIHRMTEEIGKGKDTYK